MDHRGVVNGRVGINMATGLGCKFLGTWLIICMFQQQLLQQSLPHSPTEGSICNCVR